MGYYDEEYYEPKKQKGKKGWVSSFISSISGGLVVLLLLPVLAKSGVLPYEIVMKDSERVNQHIEASGTGKVTPVSNAVQVNVSTEITDVVEQVSNAIVGVVNIQQSTDFFARDTQSVDSGTGSGVVFKKENGSAYIVTNYHVIDRAKEVEVSLANGERVKAELVGSDPLTDLAVIKIADQQVDTVATFGDSDVIKPGEPVIAIGNPLGLEFSRTVTQGIVSAKERSVPVASGWELNVIQTDAAINPGNSGGALINIKGQVIGINSLKIAQQGVEGLGFALPINDVIPIINDLVAHGVVERPYMGVQIKDLSEIPSEHWQETLKLPADIKQGIVILGLESMTPAEKAGLKEYDVIVALDDQEIQTSSELRKYLFNKKSVGDNVKVKVYRDGLPVTVTLHLTKTPTNQLN